MYIKEELYNYYKDRMKLEKTQYEINVLRESIKNINEKVEKNNIELNDFLTQLVKEKNVKLLTKEIEAEEILTEIAGIDYCVSKLEESERLLLEYKFNKRYLDKDIETVMSMSRSTIYRKIAKILDRIDKAIS